MKIKRLLRKAHRYIGVFAALWLLLLASTGLLLQHSSDWRLDKSFITNQTLLKLYGVGQHVVAFKADNDFLIQIDKELLINQQKTPFSEPIQKVAFREHKWIVETHLGQTWFNQKGEAIQFFDELDPSPLQAEEIRWLTPSHDKNLINQAIKEVSVSYLSVSQVVFDIHAGITTPSTLNDLAAVALIFLSLSGLVIFFRKTA
jgi:hypothetical protein